MAGTPCRRGRPGTKNSDVGLLGGILSLRYAGWINSGCRPLGTGLLLLSLTAKPRRFSRCEWLDCRTDLHAPQD